MAITLFAESEIPKYRQANFNQKMQAFIDKFTGQTIQEINNLTGETVGQIAPTILTGLATSVNIDSLTEGQVVYFVATEDTTFIINNADSVIDYTTYSEVDSSNNLSVTSGSTLMLWWDSDGVNKVCKYMFVINESTSGGGSSGGGIATPVVPEYTITDRTPVAYTIEDY